MHKHRSLTVVTRQFMFAVVSLVVAGTSDLFAEPPGVIIAHRPAAEETYIGSPSLAILPDGSYVASHDQFGPNSPKDKVFIYRSDDAGESWQFVTVVQGQYWSNLFVHRDDLYLMGTSPENVSIRRSEDGGHTWTTPNDSTTGLLTSAGSYHTSTTPVVVAHGRIWRAMERSEQKGLGSLIPFMMSAPVEADLLDADSWTISNETPHNRSWLHNRDFRGWLEGNAVIGRDGNVWNMLRVHSFEIAEHAALIRNWRDGTRSTFDPKNGIIDFPGGAKKFTVRWDAGSQRYWSLVNWVPAEFAAEHPARYRNTLALTSSPDLRDWTVHTIVLQHPEWETNGFQYVDWQFLGQDIVAVSRTSSDEPDGTHAHTFHDANYLTFHRVDNFRETVDQSVFSEYAK